MKGAIFCCGVFVLCALTSPHVVDGLGGLNFPVKIPSVVDVRDEAGKAISKGSAAVRKAVGGCGVDRTCLRIHNRCHEEVEVAIRFKESDSFGWRSKGWWALNPGQKKYVANIFSSGSSVVYIHAVSDSGRVWRGSAGFTLNGNFYKAKEVDMGTRFKTHTHSLTC